MVKWAYLMMLSSGVRNIFLSYSKKKIDYLGPLDGMSLSFGENKFQYELLHRKVRDLVIKKWVNFYHKVRFLHATSLYCCNL